MIQEKMKTEKPEFKLSPYQIFLVAVVSFVLVLLQMGYLQTNYKDSIVSSTSALELKTVSVDRFLEGEFVEPLF